MSTSRTRKSTRSINYNEQQPSSSSLSSTTTTMTTSRRSSRSNKFTNSMKEPTESVSDLLIGSYNSSSNGNSNTTKRKNIIMNDTSLLSSPPTKQRRSTRSSSMNTTPMKSPAKRHSRARRQMKIEIQRNSKFSDDDDEDDDDEEEDDEEMEEGEYEDEDEMSYESEGIVEDDDDKPIKIQRIIAVRLETKRKWKEICKSMNTSEIENGSRWFQDNGNTKDEKERNDDDVDDGNDNNDEDDETFEERFLVKWADLSFLHCSWETKDDLFDQVEAAKTYLTNFFKKSVNGYLYDSDDRLDGDYFDPGYTQIDRILEVNLPDSFHSKKKRKGNNNTDTKEDWGIIFDKNHPRYDDELGRQFLIKWGNTAYSDATYEYERDLILMDVEYESHVDSFLARRSKPDKHEMKRCFTIEEEERRRLYKIFGDRIPDGEVKERKIQEFTKTIEEKTFCNGGKLRNYQAEGVSWLLANHVNKRSAILADEMGLGKTIQTAAYIYTVSTLLRCRGPFLIIAPLSTIPHWQREFSGWTDLNTIVYHGSAEDREVIREYEFAFECDRPQDGIGLNQKYLRKCHKRTTPRTEKIWMTQVVITTPEMLVTEDHSELSAVDWEVLVVDEAHRLKNQNSKLAVNLRWDSGFHFNHKLLLTGTPIQNNMTELWTLMNFIDSDEFDSCSNFMEMYGNMKSKESVDGLHGVIRPYILRRLKEDVEKSVPPKEETLIEVELTMIQKQYYRALYEKNVQFLHKDVKKALDGPSINNLAMQLRKCCNHPFLLNGVEDMMQKGEEHKSKDDEADFLVKASGKLVLLDKLLPKLKDGGHRILIFSQFKIMLDILEDYLALRNFKAERIDGSITGKKRQMAIDRFQSKTANTDSSFIMLLSTRAGGVGINLTAADTCIIFDSDWNPQNDLQAQARCHRIGQTKSVKVYRLLTRKTYEMQMFHMSSLKMGLDQAVLQGIENTNNSDEGLTKEEVEKLLRCGAYDIFSEEQNGVSEKESNDFIEQDIDSILARRTKTVVHENTGSNSNAAGGTFSKASFTAKGGSGTPGTDVDIDDPDFWTKMVGEAKVTNDDEHIKSGKKRARKNANYNEKMISSELDRHILLSGDESGSFSDASSEVDSDFEDISSPRKACEFDLSFDSTRRNQHLQELLNHARSERSKIERRRWGGSKDNEWILTDVDVLVKLLHKLGYNNVKWETFIAEFQADASKSYSDQEIHRMCWSVALTTIVEAVFSDINETAKRIERAELKKKEKDEHNIESALTVSTAPQPCLSNMGSDEWKAQQITLSFKKFWDANKWVADAIKDAVEFASTNDSRDITSLNDENNTAANSTLLFDAFYDNIWPALKNRGWKDEVDNDTQKRSWVSSSSRNFRFIDEILDEIPNLHPELSESVSSVILSVTKKVMSMHAASSAVTNVNLNPDSVDVETLKTFLGHYAPMQLVFDRQKHKFLSLPRKTLDILGYLRNAHLLVNRVDSLSDSSLISTEEKNYRLSKLLTISPKASLPHPSWKPFHDAVLVSAIAKHGWIDKEVNCKAIINDEEIEWGRPFGEGGVDFSEENQLEVSFEGDKEELQSVSYRVVSFLNELKDAKDLKGFNLTLVLKSYGIESNSVTDDDGQISINWIVDPSFDGNVFKEVNGAIEKKDDTYVELPTRKDLLKRAKIVLARPFDSKISTSEEDSGSAHDFVVLDQGNVLNIFLAELFREIVKGNQKSMKLARRALAYALIEIDQRLNLMSDENEGSDFSRLRDHIMLVDRVMKKQATPSRSVKNVFRAILGLPIVPPINPGDDMFITDNTSLAKVDEASGNKTKITTKKINESAIGDLAINKAIAAAKQIAKNGSPSDADQMLGVTTIETLILSVMCSQGIPLFTDDWESLLNEEDDDSIDDDFLITWSHMGNVLEVAAEKWVEISQIHLDRAKGDGLDTTQLEMELEARTAAYEDAVRLHNRPMHLAKKTVMLIEAIRLQMAQESKQKGKNGLKVELGLGNRVFVWNKSHLYKWAKVLDIVEGRKTMNATVMSIRPDATPAGFLDKKNCKAVITQISQQTRLRSLFTKYGETKLSSMVTQALKSLKRNGDLWEDQPSWWGKNVNPASTDDFELLSGVLRFGYGGFEQMLRDNDRFNESTSNNDPSSRLYRSSGQQRVNSLTRELSTMDDSTESMRLMNERKNKTSQPTEQKPSTGNSIQVGIDAFFAKPKKTDKVDLSIGDSSDDSDIAVVAVVGPKRKVEDTNAAVQSKKQK